MANETEVIRQQMEETRSSLQDKLECLEEQVKGTVQEATETVASVKETVANVRETVRESVDTVKESVQDTVQSVKDTLNVERQVREHPWAMFAGAAALGFVGARLLFRATATSRTTEFHRKAAGPPFTGASFSPRGDVHSSFGGAAEMAHETTARPSAQGNGFRAAPMPARTERSWLTKLTEHYGEELNKLKSLAIGAMGGMVLRWSRPQPLPPWQIGSRKWLTA